MITVKTRIEFEPDRVTAAVNRSAPSVLLRMGARVWAAARRLMTRHHAASPPGRAPAVHEGELEALLFFAYDPSTRTEVIGPAPFGKGEAPALLEFGGDVYRDRDRRGRFVRRPRTLHYRGNPFMRPALEDATPDLAPQWADSIKST